MSVLLFYSSTWFKKSICVCFFVACVSLRKCLVVYLCFCASVFVSVSVLAGFFMLHCIFESPDLCVCLRLFVCA